MTELEALRVKAKELQTDNESLHSAVMTYSEEVDRLRWIINNSFDESGSFHRPPRCVIENIQRVVKHCRRNWT